MWHCAYTRLASDTSQDEARCVRPNVQRSSQQKESIVDGPPYQVSCKCTNAKAHRHQVLRFAVMLLKHIL